MIVYLITNLVNKKIYVGQTNGTAKRRLTEHIGAARGNSPMRIHQAIRKYGPENFSVNVLWEGRRLGLRMNLSDEALAVRKQQAAHMRAIKADKGGLLNG